jgi:hypothetical protein
MRHALAASISLAALGWAAPAFAQEHPQCDGLRTAISLFEKDANEQRRMGYSHREIDNYRERYADLNRRIAWMKAHPERKRDDEDMTLPQLEAGRRQILDQLNYARERAQRIDELDAEADTRRARGRLLRCNGMDGSVRAAPPWVRAGAANASPPARGGAKPWERGPAAPAPSGSGPKPWERGPAQPRPAAPIASVAAADRLGTVWTEEENGWSGRWVRQGNSNVFDATWTGGWTVKATLTISISGDQVSVHRVNASDNNSCNYRGTLNGNSVRGTYQCTSGGGSWSATIQ